MKNLKVLGGALFFLLFISLISCQPPPTTVSYFPEGYTIVGIDYQYLKAGEGFNYLFYVRNQSNGVLLDNTTVICSFHLVDYKGDLIFLDNTTYVSDYWYISINGSNISDPGFYYFGVDCDNDKGGSLSGVLEVKKEGFDYEKPNLFIMIIFYGLILFLLLYNDEDYKDTLRFFASALLIIGGFIFLIYDFGAINETLRWSIVVVNWGVAFVLITKNLGLWLETFNKI